MNKIELQKFLFYFLKDNGYENIMYSTENYIIAEGELPICLIAHLDTVFTYPPNQDDFLFDSEKQILWSPYGSGFDDRIGVSTIISIINLGYRPSIIFTQDEEIGGGGAFEIIKRYKKCPFRKCNFLIELDRMGEKDCVFYKCNNKEFVKYIESFGFEEAQGTFTDISIIAPKWKIAAVNLSIGYIDEHTTSERLNLNWYENIFKKIISILDKSKDSKFYKYISKEKYITIGTKNKCFLCDRNLRKKAIQITEYNGLAYNICEKCYQEYYNNQYLTT